MPSNTTLYDITVPIEKGIPLWPGSPGFSREWTQSMEDGAEANVSLLNIESHSGTHIDAPLHFVKGGRTVDSIPLETLTGNTWMAEIRNTERISASHLESAGIPENTKRLLIKTDNDRFWRNVTHSFNENFTALTADAAQWVVDRGIKLVGIDYLSIQKYHDGPETHLILLENGVIILETINLSAVKPGLYELYCLPLLVEGAEAAPARVILKKYDE